MDLRKPTKKCAPRACGVRYRQLRWVEFEPVYEEWESGRVGKLGWAGKG